MKQTLKLSLVALALVAGSAAQAQSAGTWMARVGATGIYPQVSSGDLSPPAWPNTQTDVSSDWSLGGGITYMITDNWSVDLPLVGVWVAEVELGTGDALPAVGDRVRLEVLAADGPGVAYSGTVRDAGEHEGRAQLFIVGGAGGLGRTVDVEQTPARPGHQVLG